MTETLPPSNPSSLDTLSSFVRTTRWLHQRQHCGHSRNPTNMPIIEQQLSYRSENTGNNEGGHDDKRDDVHRNSTLSAPPQIGQPQSTFDKTEEI
ncbi:hypothetical protein [Rhizomicrobium electricum]|uniref:hypothetical protein n=1 Tax=Rhizomicrobium electricum TaxID=480070 RepID=UPI00141DDF86|nr:hypothetical protein [Rhizomicrobium electricum]NIJ49077.1 hypothetical protein [Rhizomicrobium electricum]